LDDPRFVELSKRSWEAASWKPDDPRVEELADAMSSHFLANPTLLAILTSIPARTDDDTARYGLIDQYGNDREPAWAKLSNLVLAKLHTAGVSIPR
jgi:hypothetical protein